MINNSPFRAQKCIITCVSIFIFYQVFFSKKNRNHFNAANKKIIYEEMNIDSEMKSDFTKQN